MKPQIQHFASALALILFFSPVLHAATKAKSEVVTIQTSAICDMCKERIEKALKSTDGIMSANLNLKDKKVKVKYDAAKITADKIRTVIANTGYDADNVKASQTAYNKLPHCCQKGGEALMHSK